MSERRENLNAMRVVAVRHIGPYAAIGRAFDKLAGWAGPRGAFQPDAWMIAIYHDDPAKVPPEKLRSDAAIVTDLPDDAASGIEQHVIPAGRYLVKPHRGSYDGLGDAWHALIRAHGAEADERPCFERYLNTPRDTAPQDLVTELYLPVRA